MIAFALATLSDMLTIDVLLYEAFTHLIHRRHHRREVMS